MFQPLLRLVEESRSNRKADRFSSLIHTSSIKSISGQVKRASTTKTVDVGSIPGRVKLKTIKICIHYFPV